MKQQLLLVAWLTTLNPCWAWSRLAVPNRSNKSQMLHCGGAIMTDKVRKTIRGENPDVPVGIISRFPMKNRFYLFLSNTHTIGALSIFFLLYFNLILPKPSRVHDVQEERSLNDKRHIWIGRIISWLILPWYFPGAYLLNSYAIAVDAEDWKLAPGFSEWRIQVSFIVPFGMNTTTAAILAFALNRHVYMPNIMAMPLMIVSLTSGLFWVVTGYYSSGSVAFGAGQGSWGRDVPGYGDTDDFYQPMHILVLILGTTQAGLDLINARICWLLFKNGPECFPWKEQHKWGVTNFIFNAIYICVFFIAFIPFCVMGGEEWTCLDSPFWMLLILPWFYVPQIPLFVWAGRFLISLFGMKGTPKIGTSEFQGLKINPKMLPLRGPITLNAEDDAEAIPQIVVGAKQVAPYDQEYGEKKEGKK